MSYSYIFLDVILMNLVDLRYDVIYIAFSMPFTC